MIEGLAGGQGKGFSKKESQQIASKLTLQKLRREPQFIDAVFAAKGNRTKMEEEPVENVPDPEQQDEFLVGDAAAEKEKHENPFREEVFSDKPADEGLEDARDLADERGAEPDEADGTETVTDGEDDRESIIAAAEAAAFEEKD